MLDEVTKIFMLRLDGVGLSGKVVDAITDETAFNISGFKDWVSGGEFCPNGSALAIAGRDGVVLIWNMQTGEFRHILSGHTKCLDGLKYSNDGKWLASYGDDLIIRIWNVSTGECTCQLCGLEFDRFESPKKQLIHFIAGDQAIFFESQKGSMPLVSRIEALSSMFYAARALSC